MKTITEIFSKWITLEEAKIGAEIMPIYKSTTATITKTKNSCDDQLRLNEKMFGNTKKRLLLKRFSKQIVIVI